MRCFIFGLLVVVGASFQAVVHADDAKEEAIKRDRKQIEGTWRVTALIINGKQSKQEDARKFTVVNDATGRWSLRTGNTEISKGTSRFDPTKKPKTIDFTPSLGEAKGDHFVGIYELGENTRKLCFAASGKARPTEFSATTGNQQILVTFERVKAP